jgi:hypothetical protein
MVRCPFFVPRPGLARPGTPRSPGAGALARALFSLPSGKTPLGRFGGVSGSAPPAARAKGRGTVRPRVFRGALRKKDVKSEAKDGKDLQNP